MIKKSFLKKQVIKTKKEKKTTNFLRRFVLLVVDSVLKKHYCNTYSMKCLQSSLAIGVVLEKLDIRSRAYVGAVCVSQAFIEKNSLPNWNGFWGDDHHVWLCTEFGEFVDLTIHYLHLHPVSDATRQLQVPALWWEDTTQWPYIIKYLPEGPVNPQLQADEMKDLEIFKKLALSELELVMNNYSVPEVEFEPILHGTTSMNELYLEGNPWLEKSLILQKMNIPHPPWVQEREAELTKQYAKLPNN